LVAGYTRYDIRDNDVVWAGKRRVHGTREEALSGLRPDRQVKRACKRYERDI